MTLEPTGRIHPPAGTRRRPLARALQALRSPWRRLAATMLIALLQACGGNGGDAEAPPPAQAMPTLSGRVSNGATSTDIAALQVTIKGNVGTARTAEGRLAPIDGNDYLASLDQLSGPYLLSDSAVASSGGLYSVATGPGTANLTPLTTLLVAQLFGAEPHDYFAAQGVRGGFTAADDASIAQAEQQVRRSLKRDFGFDLPAGLGSFVTTPFSRVAGDPMFDAINAVVARIGSNGDYSAAVTAVAQESARCKAESLSVQSAAGVDPFCPFARTNEADPNDAGIQAIGFTNRRGDGFAVRLRGTAVVDLTFTTAEGVTSRCSGAACSGVTVGTPAADFTQTLTFAATPLSGSTGVVTLGGSLRTSVPGITLPGLPCTINRYYLIHEQTRTAEGYCSTPDSFGLGAAGQSFPSGATRRVYTFDDSAAIGPYLEVVTEGNAVIRALVYSLDPNTGLATALFQCRGNCAGATLGASTVDQSVGAPVVLQPIRFNRVVLPAVLPDGSLSTTDSVTVEAGFVGNYVDDPSALPLLPVACAATSQAVTAQPSDQAQPITVCDPDDSQGFQLRSTFADSDGNTVFNAGSLLTDGQGSFASGNGINVTTTPAGAIVSVTFDEFNGPRYQCLAAACAGIAISAVNGAGERTISFAATSLQELGTAGLPADRSLVLNGRMVAPPP